jgi:hypothetical protein
MNCRIGTPTVANQYPRLATTVKHRKLTNGVKLFQGVLFCFWSQKEYQYPRDNIESPGDEFVNPLVYTLKEGVTLVKAYANVLIERTCPIAWPIRGNRRVRMPAKNKFTCFSQWPRKEAPMENGMDGCVIQLCKNRIPRLTATAKLIPTSRWVTGNDSALYRNGTGPKGQC